MTSPPPKGLIVPLLTPLDGKGGIDGATLRRLIDRALPCCDGLLIGEPSIGEGLYLPNALRLELLRTAVDASSGRKPLFLCPTAATTEETLNNVALLTREFLSHEGKEPLFWVDTPLWHHSNRKLPQHYEEWTSHTPFPILLYNHPALIATLNLSLKRNNLRTAVLKRLAENEQMVGLIQAGDFKRTLHYQRAVRTRREFRLYDGDEMNFLNSPSSSGVVSAGANLLPSEWKDIVTASLKISEDPARNLLLLRQSQKLKELGQALQGNPAFVLKFALQKLGVIPRAEVLEETRRGCPGDSREISQFLQANFSLQPPS